MTDLAKWSEFLKASTACHGLDYVWRYGSIPVVVRENVAAHSYWVSHYAAMIHLQVDRGDERTLAAVLLGSVIHDQVESKTGDHVRTAKYKTPEFKAAADELEKVFIAEFPPEVKLMYDTQAWLKHKIGSFHHEDPEQNNILGGDYVEAVIKLADFMSLFHYMKRELLRGNQEISPYYERMISDLEMMAKKATVVHTRHNGRLDPAELYQAMANEATILFVGAR